MSNFLNLNQSESFMNSSNPVISRPSAVIFDLDGTLLDTEPLYTEASQRTIARWGKTFDLSLKKKTMGGDARASAKIIIDHFDLPLDPEEYVRLRETHLVDLFKTAPEILGAGDFVTHLHERHIIQGIATSSHQHLCELKLETRTWKGFFHTIICGDHPNLEKSKPAPDIFLLCARTLGINAESCLVFEDSPKGIQAARDAGMQVIAINSPWVEDEDLAEAHLIIDNFQQMKELAIDW